MNEIKEIMKMIDDALTQNYSLWDFSFDIGEYLNDNFEEIETANPKLADYLNEELPSFAESYDATQDAVFISGLRSIYKKALTLI